MPTTQIFLTTAVDYLKIAYYACTYEGDFPPNGTHSLTWYSTDSQLVKLTLISPAISNSNINRENLLGIVNITKMPWPSDLDRPITADNIFFTILLQFLFFSFLYFSSYFFHCKIHTNGKYIHS